MYRYKCCGKRERARVTHHILTMASPMKLLALVVMAIALAAFVPLASAGRPVPMNAEVSPVPPLMEYHPPRAVRRGLRRVLFDVHG